ncbi:CYTH and CHAD domain-containing protein [Mycolicibacterium austroafricanum]|uniref:CYTH and CHAD domain-containing protein n=1 Tax=Mycolicibacterium austroafricanum TaxID=39687 RepID=UPI001CA33ECA|nr:CYTH and CHAD domain-containing protein [Mycolicibacterium austroafricanum]QZT54920.1 CYTH and CHAD domain-containing protein [Mycolicibacterium austroafricanum]
MAANSPETSRHTETERKFEVVEATVSPSFDGLSAVGRVERSPSQSLDAVYFDTPGRDLARHRITLRRRTGGTDAGWHLKLPAGADSRTEVHAPLSDDGDAAHPTVPESLRDIVLAIVRDRPLAPVARISTLRNVDVLYGPDGSAVAEFCDDQVTASAVGGDEQHWREWELELGPGADTEVFDRLTNRLLDAGARPAGHGSKLARVLESSAPEVEDTEAVAAPTDPARRAVAVHLEELIEWDRAVRADAWDSVHQMRVTTRKIRSLLQSSEGSFDIADHEWVLDELRELAAVLGAARDAEVLAERYQRAIDKLPEANVRGPVRERLVDGAERRYQTGWKRSLTAMRSQRYFRLLDALEELIATEPVASGRGETPAELTIDSAYKRVRKAAKAARAAAADAGTESDEALHRIRKRAKQLRYTAAAIGENKVAERAKVIQSLLGDHQDSVVSRAHLSRQAQVAHTAGEDTFTYGLLYQQEDDLAARCEEQIEDALRQLDKSVGRR